VKGNGNNELNWSMINLQQEVYVLIE